MKHRNSGSDSVENHVGVQIGMRQVPAKTVEWFGTACKGGEPTRTAFARGFCERQGPGVGAQATAAPGRGHADHRAKPSSVGLKDAGMQMGPQMGPASGTWRPQARGIEGRTGHTVGDRPDKSWVRALQRDRCQRVPTRHDQMPNRSSGGDLNML